MDCASDALHVEMIAGMVVFEVQPEGTTFVPGYKQITGHVVWDVKMDFTRKAMHVAGGHYTDPNKALTYLSVVSRESVRIALLVAALNDLGICLTDIGSDIVAALTTWVYA
jgi:hypothetical protein